MYHFIPTQLLLYWNLGVIHLLEQLQLNISTPDFLKSSSPLIAANIAVRELSIYTNEVLVTRLSSCTFCSHRVGVEVEGTHKHFEKDNVGVKVERVLGSFTSCEGRLLRSDNRRYEAGELGYGGCVDEG